eukprot:TRINITY_DN454_c0_g1_i1.p1 TRINITY_DN454_c0_g1~~TRINITY_DN454_c0_g1_i1.p1  ORF type:complete len:232 (-),score=46.39 TRINITY_DN454_c0_g1_i1:33-728(-)
MPRKQHASRNPLLVRGIERYSRSAMYRRSGRAAVKKAKHTWKKVEKPKTEAPQKKKGFYTTDPTPKPAGHKVGTKPGTAKLRSTITPGTILIVLAGRFRGKRVVFLKQLGSGLLLVTGPFKINGVPLRRINQSYVIATTTKVDLTGVKIPKRLKDAYFKRPKETKKDKKGEEDFFTQVKEKKVIAENRVKDQKEFDSQILAIVQKTPKLEEYLHARFSLSTRSLYPHNMKF